MLNFMGLRVWTTIIILVSTALCTRGVTMQNDSSHIQKEIKTLCIDRIRFPGDFTEFTNRLMSLGVIRQTYDVLENSLSFYSKDALLYHLPMSEIETSSDQKRFVIGDTLDMVRVKSAIDNIDNQKRSIFEFHRELAQAGIVHVSVFLNQKTVYYFSQDGKYFLEMY